MPWQSRNLLWWKLLSESCRSLAVDGLAKDVPVIEHLVGRVGVGVRRGPRGRGRRRRKLLDGVVRIQTRPEHHLSQGPEKIPDVKGMKATLIEIHAHVCLSG